MSLLDAAGQTVATQNADSLGGLLFRNVPAATATSYAKTPTGRNRRPLTVYSDQTAAPWDPGIYNQSIPDNGYSYLTTRDGTQLAIDVHPPTSPAGEPGLPAGLPVPNGPDFLPPYPTLIEYSGYGYADPAGPVSGIAVLANLMGFAVVDVNMRGTGCSGGAFDFFEPLQSLDGYDVIETIAHQPWVRDHKVGMMGISYGGISQLFTARLDPPDLEAISPLSVLDATATTLYPGGVLNTGFAVDWAQQRQQEAEPAGTRQRTALGVPADPERRHDVRGQPGAARRGGRPELEDRSQRPLRRRGRRRARPGHVRQQDQCARVHGLPVGGRTDGRALPGAGPALHRDHAEVVHLHQRRAHRLARPRDLQPLVRLLGVVRRAPGADRERGNHRGRPRRSSTRRQWAFRRPIWSRCRPTPSS